MRLIDGSPLRDRVKKWAGECTQLGPEGEDAADAFMQCLDAIVEAPTIDPVTHGRWIHRDFDGTETNEICAYASCSNCGCKILSSMHESAYCPKCGACMEDKP